MNDRLITIKDLCCLTLNPMDALNLSLSQWDIVIRLAMATGLLPRLAVLFDEHGIIDRLPHQVRWKLLATINRADKHQRDTRLEISHLAKALDRHDHPICLLKGAAYVAAGLSAAKGRLFSDIDLMTPKTYLAEVEQYLTYAGWLPLEETEYDEYYYRTWMHQIPPIGHLTRGSILDVHHTITPETARYPVDSEELFDNAVALEDGSGLYVLSPPDMVLHSATHLFLEGETDRGLRDLSDISLMLNDFRGDEDFWQKLLDRAERLGLMRQLFYAVYFLGLWFAYDFPQDFRKSVEDQGRPSWLEWQVLNWVFGRALPPQHDSVSQPGKGFAKWLLYTRGHYLRMPLYLLIPHLIRKALPAKEAEKTEDLA